MALFEDQPDVDGQLLITVWEEIHISLGIWLAVEVAVGIR